ncbi:MAG: FG-GAP-like repeat-containing protein [Pirellulales bacterium]
MKILAPLAAGLMLLAGCNRQTPEIKQAAMNRGVGLMGKFMYSEAHDVFEQLHQQHPDDADVAVNLAIARLNRQLKGDEASALELLAEVLKKHPGHLRARFCSGLLLLHGGNARQALGHFLAVAKADPKDAYAAYYVAQCLAELDRRAEALQWYRKALRLDPYLRSAYYAAAMIFLQRDHNKREAERLLGEFKRLEGNPQARLAQFKYTRMGPKSLVISPTLDERPAPLPEGPIFAAGRPLTIFGADNVAWNTLDNDEQLVPSLTACDINGDGRVDLFAAAAIVIDGKPANAVLLADGPGYRLESVHPLTPIDGVQAALWGDYDNDGLTDVYLCRRGGNQLWRQAGKNEWTDVTESALAAGAARNSTDGAIVDTDHDGDLDLLFVNRDGPLELLSNNLDGTFRPLAESAEGGGIDGDGGPRSQPLTDDLDGDRDADLVVLKPLESVDANGPRHSENAGDKLVDIYLNDRLWKYSPADGFDDLARRGAAAIVAADADADGQVELYSASDGSILRWQPDRQGTWRATQLAEYAAATHQQTPIQLAITDLEGDGRLDLAYTDGDGWSAISVTPAGGKAKEQESTPLHLDVPGLAGWLLVNDRPAEGPSLVALRSGEPPLVFSPGPGRHRFAAVTLSGKEDKNDQTRSNASGIGAKLRVRVGSRWTVLTTYRLHSGPGQSLQPLSLGLGGANSIDFIQLEWSDGLLQSETELAAAELHRIEETQRQMSSCPVLFAWNGERYRFVTDLLGVGGLGFAVGPGQYAPARGFEHVLLPAGSLAPLGGRLCLKLHEPMEEVCYVDSVRLVAYDLPPGWRMTLDERMGVNPPEPTGEARFYQHETRPVRAVNDRGHDVLAAISAADRRAAPPGRPDRRFLGRTDPHTLTLAFDRPLDQGPGQPMLVIDGWIEYPYSQTMFAAWQAGAEYVAPSIEAGGRDGRWHQVLAQFGYPAGMPRQASVPLPGLPRGASELRLSTNQEIYWDRIAVAYRQECPQAVRRPLELRLAELRFSGFPQRTTGPQRVPGYDYSKRGALADMRYPAGYYTDYGPVEPLLRATDDALAIFGPGEELHLEFEPLRTGPRPGWTRHFVLEAAGWCKDMDLYTKHPDTVEPLPEGQAEQGLDPSARSTLHRAYQTRYQSGP